MEDDAVAQLPPPRPHDLVDVREPEGDEEQAGLVDVPVVTVDDVDLGFVRVEVATQPVGGHRASRPTADDHDLLLAHDAPPVATSMSPVGCSRRSTNSMPASIERRSGHE